MVEQPLPLDLTMPLSAFDPFSVPDVPTAPTRLVLALATPPRPAIGAGAAPVLSAPRTDATLQDLLARLERSIGLYADAGRPGAA